MLCFAVLCCAVLRLARQAAQPVALAVALERAKGGKSWWHPYLQSVPDAEPLPLLWPDQALRLLRGTRRRAPTSYPVGKDSRETCVGLVTCSSCFLKALEIRCLPTGQ